MQCARAVGTCAESEEGQRALNEWAAIIADWAFEQMPRDLLEGLASREGKKVLEEIWPDIVNAYFKALSNPGPQK
jgi:hypothetical protein